MDTRVIQLFKHSHCPEVAWRHCHDLVVGLDLSFLKVEIWRTPDKISDENLLDGIIELIMNILSDIKIRRWKGGCQVYKGVDCCCFLTSQQVICLRQDSENKLTAYQWLPFPGFGGEYTSLPQKLHPKISLWPNHKIHVCMN